MPQQSARDALNAAETYVRETIALLTQTRSAPALAAVVDAMVTHRSKVQVPPHLARELTPEMQHRLGVVLYTATAARQWQRHKVVYRLHPELAAALVETDPSTQIPCQIFRRLPHPDPFVAFPEPIARKYDGDIAGQLPVQEPSTYTGMLLTGGTADGKIYSTADPRATALNVHIAARVLYINETAPQYEEQTLQLPMDGQHTVHDLAASYVSTAFDRATTPADLHAFQLAIAILLYLCSDDPDSEPHRPSGRRRKPARKNAPTLIDLGFQIGPALHADRHRTNTPDAGGTDAGRTVRPHIRRAHWHTYWTGPRTDQTPTLRWLHPTVIHRDQHQAATVVDVVEPD